MFNPIWIIMLHCLQYIVLKFCGYDRIRTYFTYQLRRHAYPKAPYPFNYEKKIIDNLTSSQLKTYQIVHFRFGHVVSIIKFLFFIENHQVKDNIFLTSSCVKTYPLKTVRPPASFFIPTLVFGFNCSPK